MRKISMETYILTAVFGLALGILSGCSYKTEILWHGRTPVGIDERKSTAMTAAASPIRQVKLSRAGERVDED